MLTFMPTVLLLAWSGWSLYVGEDWDGVEEVIALYTGIFTKRMHIHSRWVLDRLECQHRGGEGKGAFCRDVTCLQRIAG